MCNLDASEDIRLLCRRQPDGLFSPTGGVLALEGNVSLARNVTTWQGTCYLTPLIGAVLADAYWGRYWTITVFSTIYFMTLDRKEFSSMLHKALEDVIILETFPKTTINVFTLVLEFGGIAQKEVCKQLGDCTNNLKEYKSSTNARLRRPGILGKSYNYKHRYSAVPSENDDTLMSSQEMVEDAVPSLNDDTLMPFQEIVEQDILDAPNYDSQQKLIDPSSSPSVDLQEMELAGE